jgi:hypothetical protein
MDFNQLDVIHVLILTFGRKSSLLKGGVPTPGSLGVPFKMRSTSTLEA